MKSYANFNEWKSDQSEYNQDLISQVTKIVSNIAPELDTTVKWGQGCWTNGKNHKFFIHCKPDHIQLGFYNGSELKDPKDILEGDGKFVKHIKIYSSGDIEPNVISELIDQVI